MGPCAQMVYTLAPKYLYRDYIKANVYTIWVHGPLGVYMDPRASPHIRRISASGVAAYAQ